MKIKTEIDMEEFYESFAGETLAEALATEMKVQIMRIVKKDPSYKAYIQKKAQETLESIKL